MSIAVQEDLARWHVAESLGQCEHGGFAGAGTSNQPHPGPGLVSVRLKWSSTDWLLAG